MSGDAVDMERVRRALASLDRLAAGRTNPNPSEGEIAALAAELEVLVGAKNERVGIRISPELRERIEAYRQQLASTMPEGVREPSLSDAARLLIVKGLEALDG